MQGLAVKPGCKCDMGVNGASSRAAAGAAHLHAAARHDRCFGLCMGCSILHRYQPWFLLLGLQMIRPSPPSCITRARGLRSTSRVSASGPTVCPTHGPTRRWRRLLPLQQCCWCLGGPSQALALLVTELCVQRYAHSSWSHWLCSQAAQTKVIKHRDLQGAWLPGCHAGC